MLQAPQVDRLSLDHFSLQQDGLAEPEVDVGGGEIVEAFVIGLMVVALDEGCDLGFEIAGEEVVLQQDAVLEGLMPTLDLALGLGMHWSATDMAQPVHSVGRSVFRSRLLKSGSIRKSGMTMSH
jgi:hypothetical protein